MLLLGSALASASSRAVTTAERPYYRTSPSSPKPCEVKERGRKGDKRTKKQILGRVKAMPQPSQGELHGRRGDLARKLSAEVSHSNSSVETTQNAKGKIISCPSQMTGGMLAWRNPVTSFLEERKKTEAALKPAISTVQKGIVELALDFLYRQCPVFHFLFQLGPNLQ